MPLIITGLQNIFHTVPVDEMQALQPLKIIQIFYMQHDHLVPKTLVTLFIQVVIHLVRTRSIHNPLYLQIL